MAAKRKKEQVEGTYFRWLLNQRNGMWQADGRSNQLNAGRHSLDTRSRDEALTNLRRLDLIQAVKLGLADHAVLGANDHNLLGLDHGVELYYQHVGRPKVAGGAKESTLKRYRAIFDKAVPFFKRQGLSSWNQVKRRQLEQYTAWLDAEGYAYATEFIELTTIKQAINFWIADHRLPLNCQILMPLVKPTESDTYCWNANEVNAIMQRCYEDNSLHWLGNLLIALACTGMRISELANLQWTDVDMPAGMITLKDESTSKRAKQRPHRSTKSGRSRSFPIHRDLMAVFVSLQQNGCTGKIFAGPKGGTIRPDGVRQILIKKVLTPLSAQFPSDPDEIGFKDGRLHSFRHYFCSTCANSGAPEQMVMRWLGHQSSAMVRRYYHLHDAEAKRQMEQLEFLGGTNAV